MYRTFCVSVCAHCLSLGTTENILSALFAPSLQIFILTDEIPSRLLFPRLNSCSFLSLLSSFRCSRPLIAFIALCWTHSSKFIFSFCWETHNWSQHTRCSLTSGLKRGRITSLHLLSPLLVQPSVLSAFLGRRARGCFVLCWYPTRHPGCFLQSCFVVFGLFTLQQ